MPKLMWMLQGQSETLPGAWLTAETLNCLLSDPRASLTFEIRGSGRRASRTESDPPTYDVMGVPEFTATGVQFGASGLCSGVCLIIPGPVLVSSSARCKINAGFLNRLSF